MAPDLTTTDGDVVAEDLTPAEIDRLRRAGVSGPWDDQDPDGDGGSADADPTDDSQDQDADPDPDADTGDPTGDDTQDEDGDAGDPDDPDDPDGEPDATGDDPGDGDDDDAGDEPGDGDAGQGGDADGQEPQDEAPDADGDSGGDAGQGDGTGEEVRNDDTDAQGGGDPDQGPDLDASDLDDLDDWDDTQDPDGDQDPDADDSHDPDGDANGTPGDGDPDADGDQETDTDPDDLADQIDEMADRAEDREVEAQDFDPDLDVDEWSDKLDRARDRGGIREARRDRDDRLEDPDFEPHVDAESIHGAMKANGLDRSIREEFEKIKRAPRARNARSGSEIDTKRATRLFSGDATANKVYLRQNGRRERARRAVGVCLDLSGSMTRPTGPNYDGPTRIEMAKVALAGLATACEAIGDTFTATGFEGTGEQVDYNSELGIQVEEVAAPLITGPDEEFNFRHLDAVEADGGTPMAQGIRLAAKRLAEVNQPDKTLIVIADGEPTQPEYYEGPTLVGYEDTDQHRYDNVRATIEQVRAEGIGVVGIGIGDVGPKAMAEMFGEDSFVMADGARLPEKLREVYEGELDTVHGARNR